MKTLKYPVIKSATQYKMYCDALQHLLEAENSNKHSEEEIELLTLLIGKWDEEHTTLNDVDPVALLHSLMRDHRMKAKDLVVILGVSKSLVSDILNYKRGLSKDIIRGLSAYFKVSQEAFNRPYKIVNPANSHLRNEGVMNTPKKFELA
jgi:HTH-type transcriptional regulator / antitoxin HigA